MQGLPSLVDQETVSAGGSRKCDVFNDPDYERSFDLSKCRGAPGVLGDPHSRIPFLHTGGQEHPNGPNYDVDSYGYRGGRQGPSAPVDDHSDQRSLTYLTRPNLISYSRASLRTRALLSVSILYIICRPQLTS